MATSKMSPAERLAWTVMHARRQREWVRDHGGTREGYVARYGGAKDADRFGDGGEAIFDADIAAASRAMTKAREALQRADVGECKEALRLVLELSFCTYQ